MFRLWVLVQCSFLGFSLSALALDSAKDRFEAQLKILKNWSKKVRDQQNSGKVETLRMIDDSALKPILNQSSGSLVKSLNGLKLSDREVFEMLNHYRTVGLGYYAGDALYDSRNQSLSVMGSEQYALYRMLGGKRSFSSYQAAHRDPNNKTYRYGSAYSWHELGYPNIALKEDHNVHMMISRYKVEEIISDLKKTQPKWLDRVADSLQNEFKEAEDLKSKLMSEESCSDPTKTESQIKEIKKITTEKKN